MSSKSSSKIVIIALGVIAVLGFVGFLLSQRGEISEKNVLVINMTSKQWEYDPSEIRVKEGQQILLRIKSTDVPHGFVIEEYRINAFLTPGEVVEVKFIANKAGEYIYFCNVFCGTGHPNHKGKLIVEK
jgi:cytochrome c oxidase subunit 2